MDRRQLITGLISLVAAPAIVRVSSIMSVKAIQSATPIHSATFLPTEFEVVAQISEEIAIVSHRRHPLEFVVRISPAAPGLVVGDRVWIDKQTGEIC